MTTTSLAASFNHLPFWRRRVRVWGFSIVVPTFDRWLYLWLHRIRCMGRQERAYFSQVLGPGMHAVDVGANIGLYSLLFARLVGPRGRVFSFEPDPLMASTLRENFAVNGIAHAEVSACAIGAEAGHANLNRNAINSGDNRLGLSQPLLHYDYASVPVRALQDALYGRRIDFIKIDVQGWEGEAFRGILGLLEANRSMKIYFEFCPRGLERTGTTVPQFATLLRNLGLQVTNPAQGGSPAPADLEILALRMKPWAYTNMVASRTD